MEKRLFMVVDEHIKLLKAAWVSWDDCEFGAPCIDPKRPYGNSSVLSDIAGIIGLTVCEDEEGEKHLSAEQAILCSGLHREMEVALQILLSLCHIEAGEYECEKYGNKWRRKN